MRPHPNLITLAIATTLGLGLLLTAMACQRDDHSTPAQAASQDHDHDHDHDGDHKHDDDHDAQAVTPLEVTASVRDNLGVTFIKAQRRPVRQTLRLPGHFELQPGATRRYSAALAGRVELLVDQYQAVTPGQPLFRIDAPDWQAMRHQVVEAHGQIRLAEAQLAVAQAQWEEGRQMLDFLNQRLDRLSQANVRQIELEAQQTRQTRELPGLQAKVQARQVELDEAREHYQSIVKVAASLLGKPVTDVQALPMRMEVRAAQAGVVQTLSITQAGWADRGASIVEVIDPTMVRFRAMAFQGDLPRLRDGLRVGVVPPQGSELPLDAVIPGHLRLGLTGSAEDRTLPVHGLLDHPADWARPGVSAQLEVYLADDDAPQLAIPVASLVRDGLKTIFYRRDPAKPDLLHPVEAHVGAADDRWVVIRAGLAEGEEVVLAGAYALTLGTAGRQTPKGYHYHADGSLHQDH